jgi:hypothetical protein
MSRRKLRQRVALSGLLAVMAVPVSPAAQSKPAVQAKPAAQPANAPGIPQSPPHFAPPRAGYQEITFWDLAAFTYNSKEPYEPSPHAVPNALPDWVKALDSKKVVIRGNATPANIEPGGVSEFFLANQTDPCGFGTMPRINEWIYVNMPKGRLVDIRAPAGGTVEVLVKGTFRVK